MHAEALNVFHHFAMQPRHMFNCACSVAGHIQCSAKVIFASAMQLTTEALYLLQQQCGGNSRAKLYPVKFPGLQMLLTASTYSAY